MNYIDPDRLRRKGLTKEQISLLERLIPWGEFVQQQTFNKCLIEGKDTDSGVFASVIVAHVIHMTKWCTHPVSQYKYGEALANNLCLSLSHQYWSRSTIVYRGTTYKAFKNWRECAIDFSDTLSWFTGYEDVLSSRTVEDQIALMSTRCRNSDTYRVTISKLVDTLNLTDFDWHGS